MTKTRRKTTSTSSKETKKAENINNKRKRKTKVVEEDDENDELGPPSEEEQVEEEDLDYQDVEQKKPASKKKKSSSSKQTKSESAATSSKKTVKILPFKLKTGFSKGKRKKSFRQIISKQDQVSNDETSEDTIDIELSANEESSIPTLNYNFIAAGSYSMTPRRKYCDITGLLCKYTNPHNKIQYHSSCLNPLIQSLSEQKVDQYLSLRSNI